MNFWQVRNLPHEKFIGSFSHAAVGSPLNDLLVAAKGRLCSLCSTTRKINRLPVVEPAIHIRHAEIAGCCFLVSHEPLEQRHSNPNRSHWRVSW